MRAMAFYCQGVALVRHGPAEGSYYCDTVASGTPNSVVFLYRTKPEIVNIVGDLANLLQNLIRCSGVKIVQKSLVQDINLMHYNNLYSIYLYFLFSFILIYFHSEKYYTYNETTRINFIQILNKHKHTKRSKDKSILIIIILKLLIKTVNDISSKRKKRLVNTIQYIVDINYTLYNITIDITYTHTHTYTHIYYLINYLISHFQCLLLELNYESSRDVAFLIDFGTYPLLHFVITFWIWFCNKRRLRRQYNVLRDFFHCTISLITPLLSMHLGFNTDTLSATFFSISTASSGVGLPLALRLKIFVSIL
ncbi:hypothetical protein AGLY_011926 [Aphis glycines]|uniref:Uncharacterized protein n=1 Tax=Aphis glycines TaxID=307491 RepID=A0A6G0TCQ6_APHGL|nr:hypothetical protein AGLY_011926 [Aphis glycines]